MKKEVIGKMTFGDMGKWEDRQVEGEREPEAQ